MYYATYHVQNFANEDEHNALQKWFLDLLPIVQLLVIFIILNIVDLSDHFNGDDGRQDDAYAIYTNQYNESLIWNVDKKLQISMLKVLTWEWWCFAGTSTCK